MSQFASMSAPIPQNSSSSSTGLLPQLYLHAIGPVGKAYYQRVFTQFETLGRTPPTWNSAAAFCTLGWCLLRGLWRPAALWSSSALLVAVLVWAGALSALPLPAQLSLALLAAIVLCCVPGFLGNGWYYHQVHRHTIQALEQSPSLAQAQTRLEQQASSQKQWRLAAVGQVALWALLGAFVWNSTAPAPQPEIAVGPPQLNFPTASAPVEDTPPPSTTDPTPTPTALPQTTDPVAHAETLAAIEPSAPPPVPPEPPVPAPEPEPIHPAAALAVASPAIAAPAPEIAPKTKSRTPAPVANKTANAKPSPAPKEKAPAPSHRYYVTLGTYAEVTNAAAVERKVRQAGYAAESFSTTSNKGVLTRLRAGPFATRAEAEQARRKLRAQRIPAQVQELRR